MEVNSVFFIHNYEIGQFLIGTLYVIWIERKVRGIRCQLTNPITYGVSTHNYPTDYIWIYFVKPKPVVQFCNLGSKFSLPFQFARTD